MQRKNRLRINIIHSKANQKNINNSVFDIGQQLIKVPICCSEREASLSKCQKPLMILKPKVLNPHSEANHDKFLHLMRTDLMKYLNLYI